MGACEFTDKGRVTSFFSVSLYLGESLAFCQQFNRRPDFVTSAPLSLPGALFSTHTHLRMHRHQNVFGPRTQPNNRLSDCRFWYTEFLDFIKTVDYHQVKSSMDILDPNAILCHLYFSCNILRLSPSTTPIPGEMHSPKVMTILNCIPTNARFITRASLLL